jgi:hypothetical protein
MLASAHETEDSLIFNNRYHLGASGPNDYYIYDAYLQEYTYKNIALFSSAVKMLWYINRPSGMTTSHDKTIYSLDQEYYRCLEDIRFFKSKIVSIPEDREFYAHRLSQSKYRLEDIKTEISKIY